MALVLRGNLNRALSHAELDNNFTQLTIKEWKYESYDKDRFVYNTDENGITTLYVCVESHSKSVYKPSRAFSLSSGAKTLWKSVGDDASAGGAFSTFTIYDSSGNTTTVAAIDTDKFIRFTDSDSIAVEWTGSYFKMETVGGARQFDSEVELYQLPSRYRKQGQWLTVLDSIYGAGGMKWYTLDGGITNAYVTEVTFSGGSGGSSGSGGTIGSAEDGTYSDGLFVGLTPDTSVGTAIDRFNEALKDLAPQQPPAITSLTTNGSTGVTVKLSWGDTNNNISYNLVDNTTSNPDIDVNEVMYATGSTRLGLVTEDLTVVPNGDVSESESGSYPDYAFSDGHTGYLKLFLNGDEIDSLDLTVTTGATTGDNGIISVTALADVVTSEGKPFNNYKYRTSSFTVLKENFEDGYNYIQVEHWKGGVASSNYLDFVYDSNSDVISVKPTTTPSFTTIDLPSGSTKYISGIEYHTAGTVDYTVDVTNVYNNVYSADSTAFTQQLTNLANASTFVYSGDHVAPTTGTTSELPSIVASGATPQETNLIIQSTHTINANRIVGTGATSTNIIGAGINFNHPNDTKDSGNIGATTSTGFLFDSLTQTANLESEDYVGETYRVRDVGYSGVNWSDLNSGVYDWDSSENIITGGAGYTTGLLVFDGKLMYPRSSVLTTYGIPSGDFTGLALAPVGNPDYSAATGLRTHVRRFKSNNTTTQSTITLNIGYTGSDSDFENTYGGSPASNQIKVEFMIKRTGGTTRGWYNPFASSGNPDGVAKTSSTSNGTTVTVSATLSSERIGVNDVVLVKITANSTWSNYINSTSITNI